MFSKKMLMIVGVVVLLAVNIIFLSVASRRYSSYGIGRIAISFTAPFQETVTDSIRFVKNIWRYYFFLVSAAKENDDIKKSLSLAREENNRYKELILSNYRLRKLLNFQKNMPHSVVAAEVVGKDPSPWYKTIIINKGKADGLVKGLPVVVPDGITGQVIDVSYQHSKVLLIIDQNSAVDALVQRTRARGIIKGESAGQCLLQYVLRKHDVKVGDTVVSSGLDGVFPKGLLIGHVSGVIRRSSGIFQEVTVSPYVDFEKLEEVLVVLTSPKKDSVSKE
jgi:rod shape-determining protein MreC